MSDLIQHDSQLYINKTMNILEESLELCDHASIYNILA